LTPNQNLNKLGSIELVNCSDNLILYLAQTLDPAQLLVLDLDHSFVFNDCNSFLDRLKLVFPAKVPLSSSNDINDSNPSPSNPECSTNSSNNGLAASDSPIGQTTTLDSTTSANASNETPFQLQLRFRIDRAILSMPIGPLESLNPLLHQLYCTPQIVDKANDNDEPDYSLLELLKIMFWTYQELSTVQCDDKSLETARRSMRLRGFLDKLTRECIDVTYQQDPDVQTLIDQITEMTRIIRTSVKSNTNQTNLKDWNLPWLGIQVCIYQCFDDDIVALLTSLIDFFYMFASQPIHLVFSNLCLSTATHHSFLASLDPKVYQQSYNWPSRDRFAILLICREQLRGKTCRTLLLRQNEGSLAQADKPGLPNSKGSKPQNNDKLKPTYIKRLNPLGGECFHDINENEEAARRKGLLKLIYMDDELDNIPIHTLLWCCYLLCCGVE
ncbi:hypothetical protein NEHOM01_2493, partial [Nematocida homosporus]|uniref:uncharacterized protein n=1 Tax=Nematocida homosporus TaxID=1912981 RepID=UPI0022202AE1